MDSSILDASAFYSGVPFRAPGGFYTTVLVYDEVSHIKKSHGALDVLLETGKLKVLEPDPRHTKKAVEAAKGTGDYQQLSRQDISIIALAMETGMGIITDDYAITNVAKNCNMAVSPAMTQGIKDVGRWVHYCPGCRTKHDTGTECPACGTALKRKLLK